MEKLIAGQKGTTISVRNIFRELPVRLAQARKHRVSAATVKRVIISYALVKDIRFVLQFRGNKRLDWTVQPDSDAWGVATSIYGRDFMSKYLSTTWSGAGITIDGILPLTNDGFVLNAD